MLGRSKLCVSIIFETNSIDMVYYIHSCIDFEMLCVLCLEGVNKVSKKLYQCANMFVATFNVLCLSYMSVLNYGL